VALLGAGVLVGCDVDDSGIGPVSPEVAWPLLECDPLVAEICALPYPSNVFTVADETTPTGRRVALGAHSFPESSNGKRTDPTPFNLSDGFSPGGALIAYFPGASAAGLVTSDEIARSLGDDSPTVIIEADSGRRVAHFAGLDMGAKDPTERALLIRPAERLKDATRYIVAVRHLTDGSKRLAATPAFSALRDQVESAEPSVDARRGLYEDIFQRLEQAGVARADLQLAWDFTTASRSNNTAWLLHMRDEALELSGASGPAFTIDQIDSDLDPTHIAFRLFGTMTVPLYLDTPETGATLLFGDDGLPEPNPDQPTYGVPFEVLIPQSALSAPAGLMQYGHGLFGSKEQIEASHFTSFIDQENLILFAVDLDGMASLDGAWVLGAIMSGQLEQIAHMYDRLHQGMLNYLLAMRMMRAGFAADPTWGKYVDASRRYYYGISQGGITGGVYLALSTDVSRGALGVMGQSYNLLLPRSVDFGPFFGVLGAVLPDARHQQLALALVAQLWDRVEPTGYTAYLGDDRLPGVPEKQVLMRAAIGDHQVSPQGAHIMARAMGAKHVDTGLREIWGLDTVASATGNALVEYDFGLPAAPLCNVPNRACGDPHGELRKLDAARAQLAHFLKTGEVKSFCNGPCSFPELSGCADNPPGPDPCVE